METGISTVLCLLYPVKDKKNSRFPCAVSPFNLLTTFKRIKRIKIRNTIDMFICYRIHRYSMGASHYGQQRFVGVAYRFLVLNGPRTSHEIMDYMQNNHPTKCRNMTIRKTSSLLSVHPMFVRLEKTNHHNGRYKYKVATYATVPETVVIDNLVSKLSEGKNIMYSFRKYPEFIRNKVNHILDNFPPDTPNEILTNR